MSFDIFISATAQVFKVPEKFTIASWAASSANLFGAGLNLILVNLAINYGSKDEIINAIKSIKRKKQNISTKTLSRNLYTNYIPDPDILIRTGGKKRLSNFLLWQLAYSELYFVNKLWPDFSSNDFQDCLNSFKKRKRRFGKRV